MANEQYFLRAEAQPGDFARLDHDQQAAFRKLVQSLSDACSEVNSASDGKLKSDRYTAQRHSRTFLIDGTRGSGKTTVLLSVAQQTSPGAGKSVSEPLPEGSEIQQQLRMLQDRLVWLDILDLEPFPSHGNVFSAVVARIEAAVGRNDGNESLLHNGQRRGRSILDQGGSTQSAVLLKLQRFAEETAIGWDSNLAERRGHLDPNNYAVEVQRSERARMGTQDRFGSLLEEIALSIPWQQDSPVFVLPIDDADLNPVACRELLNLIRTLLTPRLMIVVLGDTEIFTDILSLHLESGRGRVSSPSPVPGLHPQYLESLPEALLVKYFPPNQRAKLRPMTSDEGLNFQPFEGGRDLQTLRSLLEVADPNLVAATMGRALRLKGSGRPTSELEPRLVGRLFAGWPRRLTDLWYQLSISKDLRLLKEEVESSAIRANSMELLLIETRSESGRLIKEKKTVQRTITRDVTVTRSIIPDSVRFGSVSTAHLAAIEQGLFHHTLGPKLEILWRSPVRLRWDFGSEDQPSVRSVSSSMPVNPVFSLPDIDCPSLLVLDRVTSAWNRLIAGEPTQEEVFSGWLALTMFIVAGWLGVRVREPLDSQPNRTLLKYIGGSRREGSFDVQPQIILSKLVPLLVPALPWPPETVNEIREHLEVLRIDPKNRAYSEEAMGQVRMLERLSSFY
jgi:hypothetical protein